MLVVRPERAADRAAVRALVTLAMHPNEAMLVELIRASAHAVPELALVAEESGDLVGYALFSRVVLTGAETRSPLALAPLCVRPDRQRTGIGGALVRAGLARADELGATLVTVLGDPRYYRRFGFEPASAHGIEPPSSFPVEAFLVKPLAGYDGARGRVVYPPAFDVT
jgi:putative acetyltransferase